ncbi:hypothetical protein R1Q26_05880 [Klebsiella quasipneumoniae]|uniref:hypothetical protein n=1 Tax=Klebsiella quasipneumoniae TaxID=1463165 RepID=UPI00292BE3D2|nr:hypothetical protein [Klebsiella quasipneumoniae]WPA29247.1 hypothetical protein R1Q26_05880 [Klebsiella quasipneumoniae]
MKNKYFSLLMLFIFNLAIADVTPKVDMPSDFQSDNFVMREIDDTSPVPYNTVESSGCSNIKYKEYIFSSESQNNKTDNTSIGKFPVDSWVCLSSDTVYNSGYDRSMNERIIFSKNKSSWIKVNNNKADIIPSDQDAPYKPLKLYNIKAKNAKGYVVFDENLTQDDKKTYKNARELISFCLVQDSTYSALCGSGSLTADSGQIPYVLKTLESMEIGLNNKVNDNIINSNH